MLFQLFPASTTLPTAAVLNVPASFSLPRWQCTPNVQPDLSGLTTSVTSVAIHRAVWFHYLWGNTHLMFSQICLVSLPQRQYTDLSGLTTSGAIHTQCSTRSVWSHYLWGNTQICLVSLPLGQYTPNVQPDLSGLIVRVQSPLRVSPEVSDVETVLLQTQAFRQQLPRPATHLLLFTRKQPFVIFIKFSWDPYICLQLFLTEIPTSGYNYF